MKKICLPFCFLLLSGIVNSQAHEGVVEYQKIQQPAAVIELPFHPDVVNDAMKDYLSKKGKSKGNDLKGFSTFRNTQQPQTDSVNADLYFKVERKSRQDKETSVIYLLLTMPKEGGVTNIHHLDMQQARGYLDELAPAIEAYNLELQIKEQNERVIKAESKYKNLSEESADLQKKRSGIDKKIQDNQADVKAQAAEVEGQKQKLTTLVSQRKN